MSDPQAIADRVQIEALRGEFSDAAMMGDDDRLASLFTPDGALPPGAELCHLPRPLPAHRRRLEVQRTGL